MKINFVHGPRVVLGIFAAVISMSIQAHAASNPHGYVLTIKTDNNGNLTGALTDSLNKMIGSPLACAISFDVTEDQEDLVSCGRIGPIDPNAAVSTDEEGFFPNSSGVLEGSLEVSGALVVEGPVLLHCLSAGPQTNLANIIFPVTCK
jgi:hypothetical protein